MASLRALTTFPACALWPERPYTVTSNQTAPLTDGNTESPVGSITRTLLPILPHPTIPTVLPMSLKVGTKGSKSYEPLRAESSRTFLPWNSLRTQAIMRAIVCSATSSKQ